MVDARADYVRQWRRSPNSRRRGLIEGAVDLAASPHGSRTCSRRGGDDRRPPGHAPAAGSLRLQRQVTDGEYYSGACCSAPRSGPRSPPSAATGLDEVLAQTGEAQPGRPVDHWSTSGISRTRHSLFPRSVPAERLDLPSMPRASAHTHDHSRPTSCSAAPGGERSASLGGASGDGGRRRRHHALSTKAVIERCRDLMPKAAGSSPASAPAVGIVDLAGGRPHQETSYLVIGRRRTSGAHRRGVPATRFPRATGHLRRHRPRGRGPSRELGGCSTPSPSTTLGPPQGSPRHDERLAATPNGSTWVIVLHSTEP